MCALLYQLLFLLIFFLIKHRIFPTKRRVQISDFIAGKLDKHIDFAQNKHFWTGTQKLHHDFFIEYLLRKSVKYNWSDTNMSNYGDKDYKLQVYFDYLINEYNNHLLIDKHELTASVLFEKIINSNKKS